MTKEKSAGEIVKEYLDAFFSKDVEKTLAFLSDRVEWRVQGAPGVPTVGVRYGHDAVREWLALFPKHFKPLEFEIDRTFDGGDQAVITGRLKHQILDTGRKFETFFAAICSVKDGKITAYNFLEDSYWLWAAFQE